MKQEMDHPVALLELLGELSGDDRFEELARELFEKGEAVQRKEGGKWKMCKLIDEYVERGEKQGIQNVVATCKKFGATFEEAAEQIREQYQLDEAAVRKT